MENSLKHISTRLVLVGVVSVFVLTSCHSGEGGEGSGEHGISQESSEGGEGSGEHNGGPESDEGGEHNGGPESDEEGEESGTQYALSETFDEVRAGVRLILSYESTSNSFIGTVENTTQATLSQVRVEVHLSNGIELGPTTPVDLAPGQVVDVTLPATSQPFTSWSAHPEVG